jgi:hypothetical protein
MTVQDAVTDYAERIERAGDWGTAREFRLGLQGTLETALAS